MRQTIWVIAVMLVCAYGLIEVHKRLQPPESSIDLPVLGQVSPLGVELFTWGQGKLYSHYLYLWLLQSYVTRDQDDGAGARAKSWFSLLERWQPKFESVYLLPAYISALNWKNDYVAMSFLDLGLKVLPSWRLYFTKAYLLAFHLKTPAEASYYFDTAAQYPMAPKFIRSYARTLWEQSQSGDGPGLGQELLNSEQGRKFLKRMAAEDG